MPKVKKEEPPREFMNGLPKSRKSPFSDGLPKSRRAVRKPSKKKIPTSPAKAWKVWKDLHPDYYPQYYLNHKEVMRTRRFNELNGTSLPDGATGLAAGAQGGACVCGEGLSRHRYVFLKAGVAPMAARGHADIEVLCRECRRERVKEERLLKRQAEEL